MNVDLVALAQLGGFATLGIVMTLASKAVWDAWRGGDLVSRPVYDAAVARADRLEGQLARNNEVIAEQAKQARRMARAIEALAGVPPPKDDA